MRSRLALTLGRMVGARSVDMGKKKLLRKCELKGLPTMIHSIHVISPSRQRTCRPRPRWRGG